MNIALFSDTYYPEINGVATSVYQLKKGLEDLGHNVYLFTTKSPDCTIKENEYRVFSIPFVLMKDRRVSLPIYFKWLRIVKKLNIDIIHTHTEFSFGILGMRIAKRLGIKHIHTYHTIYEDYIHYLKLPKNKYTVNFVQNASKYYCNKTSYVIAPSSKTKKLLTNYGVATGVEIIPTGLDFDKFRMCNDSHINSLKEKYQISSSDIVFVYIGRLSKEKELDVGINYFARLCYQYNHLKMIIVGDGPAKEDLIKLANDLNISDKISFTGYVAWDNIQDYYGLGQIFISNSTSETQGLTYLEALMSGLYLLVKEDEALVSLLEDGVNGYKFNHFDEFVFGFEQIKNRLGKKEVAKIDERFTQLGFAKKVESLYHKVLMSEV